MQLFEQKKSDGRWTRARFLRQIFSKNGLFSKILAFLESAQWAGWKNGLTFLIWWTLSFDLFLARARQLKLVKYHSLTHLRLFSMLSDAKLWHFEVITPQQYNGYPWCSPRARKRASPQANPWANRSRNLWLGPLPLKSPWAQTQFLWLALTVELKFKPEQRTTCLPWLGLLVLSFALLGKYAFKTHFASTNIWCKLECCL